ncbi:hypothetical protein HAX54_043991 [Datura stramonium]|uniref:RelA/SpoT domain-containing protein n=1 Tax=Datura stramonium TaxID=4076 RepID=A0ABS8SNR0_DATST|nr:hypothetical protein [Datura stramonium]
MDTSAVGKLEQALKDESVSYHVLSGRHKSLYSIYCKMLKKKLNMDEVHDIHGLRLIVENEEECYKALKVVHQLWREVPGRYKDYIAKPKCNGSEQRRCTCKLNMALLLIGDTRKMTANTFVLRCRSVASWVVTWQCETMSRPVICRPNWNPFAPCKFPARPLKIVPFLAKPDCGTDGPVFIIMIENDKVRLYHILFHVVVKGKLKDVDNHGQLEMPTI